MPSGRGRFPRGGAGRSTTERGNNRTAQTPAAADGVIPAQREQIRNGTILCADDMMKTGLDLVGFKGRQQVSSAQNTLRFRAFFGVGHVAVYELYKDLSLKQGDVKFFFLTLYWLKSYDTELILSGWWDLHTETIRVATWNMCKKIQELKATKVVFGNFDQEETVFLISVDGVHCKTYEARKQPTASVYSHKSHGPALAYELALSVFENRLVWINGPFNASTHDITMFRNHNPSIEDPQESLMQAMPVGKLAIADHGYRGEKNHTATPSDKDSIEVKRFKNRVRARHESFNARIKAFKILSETFRVVQDKKRKHMIVFETVCILCQYDLQNGHPLMES